MNVMNTKRGINILFWLEGRDENENLTQVLISNPLALSLSISLSLCLSPLFLFHAFLLSIVSRPKNHKNTEAFLKWLNERMPLNLMKMVKETK